MLALLWNERGADIVGSALSLCALSTVNLAEVVTKLADTGATTALFERILARGLVDIATFSETQTRVAGERRRATRSRGLSLGDRACLALAQERGLTALTADAAWVGATSVAVKLIR